MPGMEVGLNATIEFEVTEQDTAQSLLSGDLAVLGTPRLVAWLEAATCAAVRPSLGEGQTSVGTRIAVDHLAPSAVGSWVVVKAVLAQVDGRVLRFDVVATDRQSHTTLGRGEVTRVAVDLERFMVRAPR
jgi:predicted thioesterase